MHYQFALSLLLIAAPLAAQTVQGTVVTQGSHAARLGAHIALLDDSLHIIRQTVTDSTLGAFYLDAPRSGRYSLAVYDRLGNPYTSAPFQLDSGAVVERQVSSPALPPMFDSLPVVPWLKAGRPEGRGGLVRYPNSMMRAGHSGHVRFAFIVNADGQIAPGSLYVIESTNGDFTNAVTSAGDFVKFAPASADGRAPRVVSQLTIAFNVPGAPLEQGDIMITGFRSVKVVR